MLLLVEARFVRGKIVGKKGRFWKKMRMNGYNNVLLLVSLIYFRLICTRKVNEKAIREEPIETLLLFVTKLV